MKALRQWMFIILASAICLSCSGREQQEIQASKIVKMLKKGTPVQAADKIIIGDLDLTQAAEPFMLSVGSLQTEVRSNVFFVGCVFMGKVTATSSYKGLPVSAVFRNNLCFVECDFRSTVDFSNAIVTGMMNFSKSKFREAVTFNNISCRARDAYFSEIHAEKAFSMVYAQFEGNLSFISALFAANTSWQETTVRGKLMCNHAEFQGTAGLDLMKVEGDAHFEHSKFNKMANFEYASFWGDVSLGTAEFRDKRSFEGTFFLHETIFPAVEPIKDNPYK